jgi:hypothetical protein
LIGSHYDETPVIQTSSTGPAKHLQKLVWPEKKKTVVHPVLAISDQDGSHGKIHSRTQSGSCHHDLQLTRFGQWLDHARPFEVIQATVMISNPPSKK